MKNYWMNTQRLAGLGYRSASLWSGLSICLRIASGLILLPVIVRHVSSEHLGLWYVFISVGNAALVVEFGFSGVTGRAAAALWAGAAKLQGLGVEPVGSQNEPNLPALRELMHAVRLLYLGIAGVVLVLMMVCGAFVIPWPAATAGAGGHLQAAWYVYMASTVLLVYTNWQGALLAGTGQVRLAQQIAMGGALAYLMVGVGLLLAGLGIMGLAVAQLVQGLLARSLSRRCIYRTIPPGRATAWAALHGTLASLWPTTWRMGLVVLATYLIGNSNTLVASRVLGLEVASQYGFTLQLVMLLQSVAAISFSVQAPRMTMLKVRGDVAGLRELVLPRLAIGLATYCVGALVLVLAGPSLVRFIGSKTQLLALGPLLFFLFVRLLEFNHALFAKLVVTGNEVPFAWGALASGLAFPVAAWMGATWGGLLGLLIANFLVQSCYSNWAPVVYGTQRMGLRVAECYQRLIRSLFCDVPKLLCAALHSKQRRTLPS